jgi:hypothetical protein
MELRFVSGYVFHTVIDTVRRKLEFLLKLIHVDFVREVYQLIVECVPFPNPQYVYKYVCIFTVTLVAIIGN